MDKDITRIGPEGQSNSVIGGEEPLKNGHDPQGLKPESDTEKSKRRGTEKTPAELLVTWAMIKGGITLFRTPSGEAYAEYKSPLGHQEIYPVDSVAFKLLLRRIFFLKSNGKGCSTNTVNEAVEEL